MNIPSKLPEKVEPKRIIGNILNSLPKEFKKDIGDRKWDLKENKHEHEEEKTEKWEEYWGRILNLKENLDILADTFWFSVCKFFKDRESK
jgi:hypothetical protein